MVFDVRDGPLEITRGGVIIPPKKSCELLYVKKKIRAEEATYTAFEVIKSM